MTNFSLRMFYFLIYYEFLIESSVNLQKLLLLKLRFGAKSVGILHKK